MIYQLHWQFGDGKTEMRAQNKIDSPIEMHAWEEDVAKRHPLPKGAQWLICNEKSRHFVMAAETAPIKNDARGGYNIEVVDGRQEGI